MSESQLLVQYDFNAQLLAGFNYTHQHSPTSPDGDRTKFVDSAKIQRCCQNNVKAAKLYRQFSGAKDQKKDINSITKFP